MVWKNLKQAAITTVIEPTLEATPSPLLDVTTDIIKILQLTKFMRWILREVIHQNICRGGIFSFREDDLTGIIAEWKKSAPTGYPVYPSMSFFRAPLLIACAL